MLNILMLIRRPKSYLSQFTWSFLGRFFINSSHFTSTISAGGSFLPLSPETLTGLSLVSYTTPADATVDNLNDSHNFRTPHDYSSARMIVSSITQNINPANSLDWKRLEPASIASISTNDLWPNPAEGGAPKVEDLGPDSLRRSLLLVLILTYPSSSSIADGS